MAWSYSAEWVNHQQRDLPFRRRAVPPATGRRAHRPAVTIRPDP
jgi:hypothetical protein